MQVPSELRMSSDPRATTAIDAPPAPVRVLIAEDDADIRVTLSRTLSESGHVIVGEVETMADAIDRARELAPDVLLLDAHLGPTQVVEAARTLAADRPGMAVIFLCGEKTFTLEGDVADTAVMSVLPSTCPVGVLESSITLAAHRARELHAAREEVAEMRRQLENRKTIERAKGILMRRTRLSEQEAYRILQRTSQDRSVPMVVVAREVLESEPGQS